MKTKVEQINDLYLRSRQKGHTSALVGSRISEKPPLLIVHNETFREYVKSFLSRDIKTVTVNNLDSLRGVDLDEPLLVDNAVFLDLANEVRLIREERDGLKEKTNKLKEKINKLKEILK